MSDNKDSTSRQIEFGVVIISTYTDEITIAFGIPVDETGTPKELAQGDVILLRDFIHCFRFQPVQRNNAIVLNLENPVVFDELLKSNIISFVEKYSCFAPQLKAIPSQLDKIKVGAPIVVANIEVKHNQPLMAEMLNRLFGLQGQDMLTQEFFDFLGKYECHSVGHKQLSSFMIG